MPMDQKFVGPAQILRLRHTSHQRKDHFDLLLCISKMPPKQSRTDSRAATLFFKKHKTTVLLVLQPHESLESAQEKLLQALTSRGLTDINGDPIPDDPSDIEFGVAVDRHDLDKGWTRLDATVPELNENGSKKGAGRPKKADFSLQAAGLQDGHPVAFRFRKPTPEAEGAELDMDLDHEDPGWDVVVPSFEYEEE